MHIILGSIVKVIDEKDPFHDMEGTTTVYDASGDEYTVNFEISKSLVPEIEIRKYKEHQLVCTSGRSGYRLHLSAEMEESINKVIQTQKEHAKRMAYLKKNNPSQYELEERKQIEEAARFIMGDNLPDCMLDENERRRKNGG